DARSRVIDIPVIDRILLRQVSDEQKLEAIRTAYNSDPENRSTLLTSFARTFEFQDEWRTLKAIAERQSDRGPFDRKFYEAMVEDEAIGLGMGEISKYGRPSPAATVAGWIMVASSSPII